MWQPGGANRRLLCKGVHQLSQAPTAAAPLLAGACLGVIGTVLVAGAAFLVVQARDRSRNLAAGSAASRTAAVRARTISAAPSRRSSPASRPPSCIPQSPPSGALRVLQPGSPAPKAPFSPQAGMPQQVTGTPTALAAASAGTTGSSGSSSLAAAGSRSALGAFAVPPRAPSPLGCVGGPGGIAAAALHLPLGMGKCPSLVDGLGLLLPDGGSLSPRDAAAEDDGAAASDGPPPHLTCSIAGSPLSSAAAAAAPSLAERGASPVSCPDTPCGPRAMTPDGSAGGSPASSPTRAGLKLHVATVMRASAAASAAAAADAGAPQQGLVLRIDTSAGSSDLHSCCSPTPSSPAAESPAVASPRAVALLGGGGGGGGRGGAL